MVSPAMNALIRRSSTMKISHVLSGSTRSLSSTSSPAARACAARSAAFLSAHPNNLSQSLNRGSTVMATLGMRAFSTRPAEETENAETAAIEQEQPEQKPYENRRDDAPYRNREMRNERRRDDTPYGNKELVPDREYPPSRTLFVGNLPFFCTEADVRTTFEAIAPIENIRFGLPKLTHNTPYAHITFERLTDATAIFESAKTEPFFLEGREIRIGYAKGNNYPPARLVYFDNFNGGDLTALRTFLGPRARWVDNAWFIRDKEDLRKFRPNGLIQFHTVDQATEVIKDLHMSAGPDGLPVFLRYARDSHAGGKPRKRQGYYDQERRSDREDLD